jgi:hypothetical protein
MSFCHFCGNCTKLILNSFNMIWTVTTSWNNIQQPQYIGYNFNSVQDPNISSFLLNYKLHFYFILVLPAYIDSSGHHSEPHLISKWRLFVTCNLKKVATTQHTCLIDGLLACLLACQISIIFKARNGHFKSESSGVPSHDKNKNKTLMF